MSFATLIVEGPSQGPGPVTGRHTLSSLPPSASGSSMTPPSFRSVVAAKRSPAVFTLKIVKAQMQRLGRGKVSFNAINQMNIELQEETANLDFILAAIQKQWGTEYTLVTNDGLELDNSPATRGMKTV